MNLSLVSNDTQLEQLLRSCGMRVTITSLDALALIAPEPGQDLDVLVLDQRAERAMPPLLATVKRTHPGTGILVVLPSLEPARMLDAMRAGVNECLADPIGIEDLRSALDRLGALRPSAPKGAVFGLVGARGGVGATTVAVNLATMLATLPGARTLLIDLHVNYGDAALFLGAEPRFSVLDALDNSHRLDAAFLKGVVTTTSSGVHLLASADRPLAPPLDPARVHQLIELASSQYTYVVIDTPRTDAAVLEALEPAGVLIIVANQELSTVRSAGRIAQAFHRRYGKERVKVVMSRYDPASEIGPQDVERIVGTPVQHVFPNNYAIALASLNKGQPLVLQNHSKLAGALTRFARTLAGVPEPQERSKNGSLLGLIGGRR
jgi:pilus assembly protein CpaE